MDRTALSKHTYSVAVEEKLKRLDKRETAPYTEEYAAVRLPAAIEQSQCEARLERLENSSLGSALASETREAVELARAHVRLKTKETEVKGRQETKAAAKVKAAAKKREKEEKAEKERVQAALDAVTDKKRLRSKKRSENYRTRKTRSEATELPATAQLRKCMQTLERYERKLASPVTTEAAPPAIEFAEAAEREADRKLHHKRALLADQRDKMLRLTVEVRQEAQETAEWTRLAAEDIRSMAMRARNNAILKNPLMLDKERRERLWLEQEDLQSYMFRAELYLQQDTERRETYLFELEHENGILLRAAEEQREQEISWLEEEEHRSLLFREELKCLEEEDRRRQMLFRCFFFKFDRIRIL